MHRKGRSKNSVERAIRTSEATRVSIQIYRVTCLSSNYLAHGMTYSLNHLNWIHSDRLRIVFLMKEKGGNND